MKILAVVESPHMGNTRKIAQAMAQAEPMEITDVEHLTQYNLHDYDIVGFGSGIYFGRHDKKLVELVSKFCGEKAYTFVFSTSGASSFDKNNKPLIDLLESKNKIVLGSFGCKAFDKFGPFKLVGGINKGRPDENDLENAKKFITEVTEKYEKVK